MQANTHSGIPEYNHHIDREDTMRNWPNICANLAIAMLSTALVATISGKSHATGRGFDPGLQVAVVVCPLFTGSDGVVRIGAPTRQMETSNNRGI